MNKGLNDLQIRLLSMMSWFHNFCATKNLRYYVLGGTMLGAIRHHGFIPWDDDIDVGMPRNDYNKLVSEIGNRLVGQYYLETPESKAIDFRYPYSKLYDTTTTLVENTWPKLRRGVFIDVFPLDGFGNTENECLQNWKKVLDESNFIWARTCAVRKQRSLFKNMVIIAAHAIPASMAKDKERLKHMNMQAQLHSFDTMVYGGNTFGNWGQKEIMKTNIMGKPTLYKFENLQIYGSEKYDEYLSHMYGNWKELPPEERRVTHHDFIELNLDRGYL